MLRSWPSKTYVPVLLLVVAVLTLLAWRWQPVTHCCDFDVVRTPVSTR